MARSTTKSRTPTAKRPTPRRRSRGASSGGQPPSKRPPAAGRLARRRRWRLAGAASLGGAVLLGWLIWPFWQLSGQFATHPVKQPSRLYGRSPILARGDVQTLEGLRSILTGAGYHAAGDGASLARGSWRELPSGIEVRRRRFPTPGGPAGDDILRVVLAGGRVDALTVGGRAVSSALLDPPLVASFYGPDLRERRPFSSIDAELPEDLILSVLAIEDAGFLGHRGISITSVLRAAYANVMEAEVRQGGSTLTQQLVKNLYLTPERTFTRKLREAVLAVLLELRYAKREIFRAYLNEIYWGRSGSVNLMGVGAAAWAYFGKEPAQLSLAESALLAGMIRSPANYSPFSAPERAAERRNVVLQRLAQLEWVEHERLEAAAREPVAPRRGPLRARNAPYFADAMADEARRRFGIENLDDGGWVLLSTLSERDQEHAEAAVGWGLEALEKGWEKGRGKTLQAALVSVDPRDGGLLAYVGGRDYGRSQFDRVALARRQPGSAFKPVVYAAALAELAATPATLLDDAELTVDVDGKAWSPQNSDGVYHGRVSVRTALEKSYNVPTAKLALDTGLQPIIALARRMGLRSRVRPYPALALGTMEVTPIEMASVYATLAAGGLRPPLHGLEAVFDRRGRRLDGTPLPQPERVLDEDVAFLVSHMLQGVLDRGTGRGVRRQGLEDPLAGKTGTTNSRRDNWFAGYSPERVTLVWVGYDDNSKTRLSGARAALPIWARFTWQVRPPGGYRGFTAPPGVVAAWIDPETGGLATDRCPQVEVELFLREFPPGELCPRHRGRRARPLEQPEGIATPPPENEHPFDRWLRQMKRRRGRGV